MKNFAGFDLSTGAILYTAGDADDFASGKNDVIECDFDATSHYIDVMTRTPVALPEKPGEFHQFDYATKQWLPSPNAAWAAVRERRSQSLTRSDWVVARASEMGQPVPPEWIAYRQALRDITLQVDPWAIVWPVAP